MENIEWIEVDSKRIEAMAYDEEEERILVRFPGSGVEWCYESCPPIVWEEFSNPNQSKGKFIHDVLNHKPHHRHE